MEFCSSSRSFWTAPYPKQIIPYPGKSPVSGLARLHMTQPWFRKSSRPILLNMRTMTGDGGAGDADSLAGPRGGHTRLHECGPLQIRHARQGHTRQAGDTQTTTTTFPYRLFLLDPPSPETIFHHGFREKFTIYTQGCWSRPEPPFLAGAGAVFLVRLRLLLLLLLLLTGL